MSQLYVKPNANNNIHIKLSLQKAYHYQIKLNAVQHDL